MSLVWLCETKVWWKSKIVLYEYRYSSILYIKNNDIYKDIAEDVETRFSTSNYESDTQSPKGKNKKVIGLTKYVLGVKFMSKSVGLRAKTYSYVIYDGSDDKKNKRHKKVRHKNKKKTKFENYNKKA